MSRGYRNRTCHLLVTQKVMSGTRLNHCWKQFPHRAQRAMDQAGELLEPFLATQGDCNDLHSLRVRIAGKKRQLIPQDSFSLKRNSLLLFGRGQTMGRFWCQSEISTVHVMLIVERSIKRILPVYGKDGVSQTPASDTAFLVQKTHSQRPTKVI